MTSAADSTEPGADRVVGKTLPIKTRTQPSRRPVVLSEQTPAADAPEEDAESDEAWTSDDEEEDEEDEEGEDEDEDDDEESAKANITGLLLADIADNDDDDDDDEYLPDAPKKASKKAVDELIEKADKLKLDDGKTQE